MSDDRKVGFIGIGMMGHGLATSVQRAGYAVSFLVHPGNQPVDDLIEKGAQGFDSAAEVARASDVVFIVVTGSPEVESAVFAPGGLLEGMGPGKLVIDCSTALPESTRKVAAAITGKGARYIDAPMTRTPKEAAEGRVNVMVGAEDADFAAAEPLLNAIAENIYRGGGVSTGHQLKLLHNYVALANAVVLSEAVVCARKGGVDIETLSEVLQTGGGDSTILRRVRPYLEEDDISAFRFSISNAGKDMGYYAGMAEAAKAPSSVAQAAHQVYEQAIADGQGDNPVPKMIDYLGKPADK
ncbi:MAG: NAD(P)-dependent oxidoreductase [Rhodospirillales bacterium]|jgi:3-hydroxyisobutyrate dehydrogenase-like beta-hydroxyacid dehydrogenase|nr:NAD(P)-dependent oxidoreductase [Rhodospirillales bacterium]